MIAWMTSTSSAGMPASTCIKPDPCAERAEQEAPQPDPEGIGPTEQRDGDRVEPDGGPVGRDHEMTDAEDSVEPAIPNRRPDRVIVSMTRNFGRIPA